MVALTLDFGAKEDESIKFGDSIWSNVKFSVLHVLILGGTPGIYSYDLAFR